LVTVLAILKFYGQFCGTHISRHRGREHPASPLFAID
jgi:hypothetical protein